VSEAEVGTGGAGEPVRAAAQTTGEQLSTPHRDPDDHAQRQVPRNRFRVLVLSIVVLVLVVVFGCMLLIGLNG
jgi:hypothetical protein